MPIDSRPLVRIEPYTVIHERHDVLFTDDTTIGLHQVELDGVVSHYLRCVVHDEVHAIVFDVRDLVPALKADLPIAQDRDRQGLVSVSLRLKFSGADHMKAAAVAKLKRTALIDRDPVQRTLFVSRTGDHQFLQDTGDRRFWPVTLAA